MSAIANMRSAMRPIATGSRRTVDGTSRHWAASWTRGWKSTLKTDVCGSVAGKPSSERCDRKKALKPTAKRELVAVLRTEHELSERRACAAVGLERSVYHNRSRPKTDGPMVKLLELAWRRPEQGFGKLFKRLRRMGHGWNHKRVYRIYCSLKLNKKRKAKDVADKMSFTSGGAWSNERALVRRLYERCFVV